MSEEYRVLCIKSCSACFTAGHIYEVKQGGIFADDMEIPFRDWSGNGDASFESLDRWFRLYKIYFKLLDDRPEYLLGNIDETEFYGLLEVTHAV